MTFSKEKPRRSARSLPERRAYRKAALLLPVPTRVFLSEHDEMVSPRSDRYFAGIPTVKTFHLPDSGHYHYDDTDRSTVAREFRAMLEELQ